MFSFAFRRQIYIIITVLLLIAVWWWARWEEANLKQSAYSTGYLMYGCVIFLAGFNLRKKLSFLPLGNMSFWMQTHIYVGLATLFIFGIHIGWKWPNGWHESTLAIIYLIVSGSGIYGLYITRVYPRKITAVGEEIIYEEVPQLRKQIHHEAQNLVTTSIASDHDSILADYYENRLQRFFALPRKLSYQLLPSGSLRRHLLTEMSELDRYYSENERGICAQLSRLIKRRDDIDYQHALQWKLKGWLFFHIGLTYSLVILGTVHGLLALVFHGGWR